MSKITKKQLQHSVDLLNEENSSQHDYLMRIKRALKSIDIDILSDEFDEPKPQLKQLDQSVFPLIERESVELTGSELCKAMLARGDKYVMCLVSDSSQEDTLLDGYSAAISSITYNECFYGYDFTWLYATPINNKGEPLTAAEAGL